MSAHKKKKKVQMIILILKRINRLKMIITIDKKNICTVEAQSPWPGWKQAKNEIKEINCPTLIIHGNCDEIIPVSSSLYALNLITNNNKLLIVAPDTLHRVLKSKDANKYYLMIQEFLCKDRIRWYSK